LKDWAIQFGLAGLIGIIAFFLKSYKTAADKRDEELQQRMATLEHELQQYKLDAADRFVLKDDFIRATAQTDRKLDKIYDEIIKLSTRRDEGRA